MREQKGREEFSSGRLARFFHYRPIELAFLIDQSLEFERICGRENQVRRADQESIERCSRLLNSISRRLGKRTALLHNCSNHRFDVVRSIIDEFALRELLQN